MSKRGDREPMTEEQRALAAGHFRLARMVAGPFKAAWYWLASEFESAAMLALCLAAQDFDPSRGVKFSTFASHRIRGAMLDVQRGALPRGWRHSRSRSSPSVLSLKVAPKGRFSGEELEDNDDGFRVLGMTPCPWPGKAMQDAEAFDAMLRRVPSRHADVLRRIYGEDMTQREAADEMGLSQSRVSYIEREACDMLSGEFDRKVLEVVA